MRALFIMALILTLGCGGKSTEPVQLEHSIVDENGKPGDPNSGETADGRPRGRTLPPRK